MKRLKFSIKKIILCISAVLSLLLFLILLAVLKHLCSVQDTQQMAERWSEKNDVAQISCFFTRNAEVSEDRIEELGHTLDKVLEEASITTQSENPGARLWVDAYSAGGKIHIASDRTDLEADAIGIGGDFFLFHPLKLVTGSYFSGNDLMQDYCVIDEDAAWQLFGSNDVTGMVVYIDEIPHIITGVVKRPEGRLEEAAGLDKTLIYVSYQTLKEHGKADSINHYEIVMPNPVSDFARQKVQENLGIDEREVEVIENSSRYSFANSLRILAAFGTRSMNGKAIIYPYWENIARGYEDIIALITLVMILCSLYSIVVVLVLFCSWWRHKGWTLKDVWYGLKDKIERLAENRRMKRLEKKVKSEES